jgi:hypothetical protein
VSLYVCMGCGCGTTDGPWTFLGIWLVMEPMCVDCVCEEEPKTFIFPVHKRLLTALTAMLFTGRWGLFPEDNS